MLKLNYSVSSVPKIGPKFSKLLKKLNVYTVLDLLYHFPSKYNDFSSIRSASQIEENSTVTVVGALAKLTNVYTKNGKRLTQATIEDASGKVGAIWFNQHYLKQTIKEGEKYAFSGKVEKFGGKLVLIRPDFEKAEGLGFNTGRIVPVYPETGGVSSKWLRGRIGHLLYAGVDFKEFLPSDLLSKYNFLSFENALKQIHFPNKIKDVEKSINRFGFEELFFELLKVEKRKTEWEVCSNAPRINTKGEDIDNLIKSLPFKLTGDQVRSVSEILNDMNKNTPMNRLLEGDVSTGKTIVAVIAAYASFLNGYKTLYMAPTEILAKQHFETFYKFLDPFGIKIILKTGETKSDLSLNFDIAIGTHALLYSLAKINNLGLVIIDEQHRFGVEQREQLKRMSESSLVPHFLSMTATPIPRSLALSLYGDLSLSILKDNPNPNKKITTWIVSETKRQSSYEWMKKLGEQVFIVCPFIEQSEAEGLKNIKAAEAEFESLKSGPFLNHSIGLLHGRMKPKDKEAALNKFRSGETRILVSTPIIEVGVDIPEAAVMVIESAERYGLASLHQLRGRVGRGKNEAYCILFPSKFTKNVVWRLKHLENVNSGIELAEIDLRLRGQGDVYGTLQHGFKKYRFADFNNLSLLEKIKTDAQHYHKELDKHPLLKLRLKEQSMELVGNN